MQEFYSNGKLLVTSEYLVLDGATALAVPTKFGQSLQIVPNATQFVNWKSYDDRQRCWFEDAIPLSQIKCGTEGTSVRSRLVQILHAADAMNPAILTDHGFDATTRLAFPQDWGLGSSSTLINNIAQWFSVDPFKLLALTFGGSGYDVACAMHDHPILYRRTKGQPEIRNVDLDFPFRENLYFVHLNRKQDSRKAIEAYRTRTFGLATMIQRADVMTNNILHAHDLGSFIELLVQHEAMMSEILKMPPVAEMLFPDFNGAIKSLGAWGGDFILAATETDPHVYFELRGYPTIVPFADMVK